MIDNVQLGLTETNIIATVPPGKTYALIMAAFCNTSGADVTITVYVVKYGGTAGDSSTILKEVSIPAKDTFLFNVEKLLLEAGDKVTGLASATGAVTVIPSYTEI